MALPLTDYDEKIGHHLQFIEAGAEMCERHVRQLFAIPDFETNAADKLAEAETILTAALARLIVARAKWKACNIVS